MNNVLPLPGWYESILREIQNHVLREYSGLPAAPHRVTSAPHEYARRFNHVVCKLSLCPIDNSVAVLLLQLKTKLLSLSRYLLLQFLIGFEKLLLGQILVDRSEVDFGIFRIGKVGREYFYKVREEVGLKNWVLDVGCCSLLSPRVGHLFGIGRKTDGLVPDVDVESFRLVGGRKRYTIVSEFLPLHCKTPIVTGVSLKTVERNDLSRLS